MAVSSVIFGVTAITWTSFGHSAAEGNDVPSA